MARFVARAGLDSDIARSVGVRAVDRLKEQVEAGARRRAPDGKRWDTMRDDRVRPSHADAEAQLIPDNLRYQLRKMRYVRKGRGPGGRALNPGGGWKLADGFDLAREPRDASLPAAQKDGCRCSSTPVQGAVAKSIHAGQTAVDGTRALAEVDTRFPRAAESEFGTSGDRAALFMTGAVKEAAARLRGAGPPG